MDFLIYGLKSIGLFSLGGVVLYFTVWTMYKNLMPLKDKAVSWPFYKKIPFGLVFLVGFLLDLIFNLIYAGFVHVYFAKASGIGGAYKLFFPSFAGVTIKRLYLITVTDRVQKIIDYCYANKMEASKIGSAAHKFSLLLNSVDPYHIKINKNWGK